MHLAACSQHALDTILGVTPIVLYDDGSDGIVHRVPRRPRCALGGEGSSIKNDISIWHQAWQHARFIRVAYDFNNCFGYHALAADDELWRNEQFQRDWAELARDGCRGHRNGLLGLEEDGTGVFFASGRLSSSTTLMASASRLLPADYQLIALTASGTEAIESFYTIANAFLSATRNEEITDAALLFFEGGYVGGARMLQQANSIQFIADRALAPSSVTEDLMIRGAPYSREALAELEELLNDGHDTGSIRGTCDAVELRCLQGLQVQLRRLSDVCNTVCLEPATPRPFGPGASCHA